MSSMEQRLKTALVRLEDFSQKITETRGYTKDTAVLKVLEEIIKEQIQNENTRSTARPSR